MALILRFSFSNIHYSIFSSAACLISILLSSFFLFKSTGFRAFSFLFPAVDKLIIGLFGFAASGMSNNPPSILWSAACYSILSSKASDDTSLKHASSSHYSIMPLIISGTFSRSPVSNKTTIRWIPNFFWMRSWTILLHSSLRFCKCSSLRAFFLIGFGRRIFL